MLESSNREISPHEDALESRRISGKSLLLKDASDWLKIISLGALILMGYQALRDEVAQHTNQLRDLDNKVEQLQKDEASHHKALEKTIGRMNFYLCSKDSVYCREAPAE